MITALSRRTRMPLAVRRLLHGLLVILLCAMITAASDLTATAASPPPVPSSTPGAPNQALIDQLTKQVDQLSRQLRAVDAIVAANERVTTLIALRENLVQHASDLLGQAVQTTNTKLATRLTDQVLRIISEVRDLDQRIRASNGRTLAGEWQLAGRWLTNNSNGLSPQDTRSMREALGVGQAFADLGDPPVLGTESQLRQAAAAATGPVARVAAQLRLGAYLRDRASTAGQHVANGLDQVVAQLTGLAGSAPLGATGAAKRLVRVPAAVDAAATNAGSQAIALRQQLADTQHALAIETSRNKPITEVDPINLAGAVVEDTQTNAVISGEWTSRGADGLSVLPGAHSLPQQLIADALGGLAGTTRHWTSTTTTVQRVRLPGGALLERTEESVAQLKQAQLVNNVNPNAQSVPLPHTPGLDPQGLLTVSVSQGGSVTVTGPVRPERSTEQVSVTVLVLHQPTDGSAAIPATAWGPLTSTRPVSVGLLKPGGVSDSRTSGITVSHSEPLDVRALQLLNAWLTGRGTPLPSGFVTTYSGLTGGGLLQAKISLAAQFKGGRTSGADQDIPLATPAELLRELSGNATAMAETSLVVELSAAGQTLVNRTLFKGQLDVTAIGQLFGALESGIGNLRAVVQRVTGSPGTGPTTRNQAQPAIPPANRPSPTVVPAPTAQLATTTPGKLVNPTRIANSAGDTYLVYALYRTNPDGSNGEFLKWGIWKLLPQWTDPNRSRITRYGDYRLPTANSLNATYLDTQGRVINGPVAAGIPVNLVVVAADLTRQEARRLEKMLRDYRGGPLNLEKVPEPPKGTTEQQLHDQGLLSMANWVGGALQQYVTSQGIADRTDLGLIAESHAMPPGVPGGRPLQSINPRKKDIAPTGPPQTIRTGHASYFTDDEVETITGVRLPAPTPATATPANATPATSAPATAAGTTPVDSPVRLHGQPPVPGGQIVYALYDGSGNFLRFGTTSNPAASSDQPVDMFVLANVIGRAGTAADGTSWTAEQDAADYAAAIERYLALHWGGDPNASPEWTLIHSANSDGWPLGPAQEADLVAQLQAMVVRIIPEALQEQLAELRAQLRELVGPEQRAAIARSVADLESLVAGATGDQGGTAAGGAAAGLGLVSVDLGNLATPQGFPGTQQQLPQPTGYPADPSLAAALAKPGQRPQVDLPVQQGYPANPGLGRDLVTPPARVPVDLPPNYAASVGTATATAGAGQPHGSRVPVTATAPVGPAVVPGVSTVPGSVALPSAATQGLTSPSVDQLSVDQPTQDEVNAVNSAGDNSSIPVPVFWPGGGGSGAPSVSPRVEPVIRPALELSVGGLSCQMVASVVDPGCGNSNTGGWTDCTVKPAPGTATDTCYTRTSADGTVTRCQGSTCTSDNGTVRTVCDTNLNTNVQTCGQTNDQTNQVSTCIYDPSSPDYCAQLNPNGTEVRCTMNNPTQSCTLDGNNTTTTCDRTGVSLQCSQTAGNTTTTCVTEHMHNICNSTGPGTTTRCDNMAQICTGTTPDISQYTCSTASNGDRNCTYTYKTGTTTTCTIYSDGQHCDSTAGGTKWSCDTSGNNQVCSGTVNGQAQTCQGKPGSAPDTCVITNGDGSYVCTGKNLSCSKNTDNVTITKPTHVTKTPTQNDNGNTNSNPPSSAQASGTLKADGSNDPTKKDQAHHQQTSTDTNSNSPSSAQANGTLKADGSNDPTKSDQAHHQQTSTDTNSNSPSSAQANGTLKADGSNDPTKNDQAHHQQTSTSSGTNSDGSANSPAPNPKPSVTSSTTPSQMATIQQNVNTRIQQAADTQGVGANGPGGGNW